MATDITGVVGIDSVKKKKTYEVFVIKVVHIDGTERELNCSFFGSYIENPDFMVFTEGRLEDEGTYPKFLMNMSLIKSVEVLEIKEVEE